MQLLEEFFAFVKIHLGTNSQQKFFHAYAVIKTETLRIEKRFCARLVESLSTASLPT